MEAYFCISHLHTQIVIFIPVSQVLCPYGTNFLKTFTTVSPFLPLNSLSIISIILIDIYFFRVNFALAYAICSSCMYISNIQDLKNIKNVKGCRDGMP